jgi:hypothetical protein
LREEPREAPCARVGLVGVAASVVKAVKIHLVATGLQLAQALAEPGMVEQGRLAVEVRNDEQGRADADVVAEGQGVVDFVRPRGRHVVDRNVDGHGSRGAPRTLRRHPGVFHVRPAALAAKIAS